MLVLWNDENQSYIWDNNGVKLIVIVSFDWFEILQENRYLLVLTWSFNGNSNWDEARISLVNPRRREQRGRRGGRCSMCPSSNVSRGSCFVVALWRLDVEEVWSPVGDPEGAEPFALWWPGERRARHPLATQREMVQDSDPEGDGPGRLLVTQRKMVQIAWWRTGCWRPGRKWSKSPAGDLVGDGRCRPLVTQILANLREKASVFPRKIYQFCLTEDCFVKLVIYRKNLPQERFSDLFMLR